MKKRIKSLILILVAGLLLGMGIAVFRILNWSKQDATLVNGVWQANREMDLGNDKLLTARVAFAALFALKPSEVIYMAADRDNEGNPLSAENDYLISGGPIDSRYWSITLYGDDYFLVPNPQKRYGYSMHALEYAADSSYSISLSSSPQAGNWIPSGEEDQFYLLLRLYHPSPYVVENIESIPLPDIQKVEASR